MNSKIFRDLVFFQSSSTWTATHVRMSGADLSVRSSFIREAMVRAIIFIIQYMGGVHRLGEELLCQWDEENRHDPYPVAVLKSA